MGAIFRAARAEALPYLPVLHTPEEDDAFFAGLAERCDAFLAGDDGFIVVSPGHVEQLYVHPRAQGQGIGSALLRHAQSLHRDGLELWVFQRNTRAIAFYERRGFTVVRRTDGASNEEREPDVLMRW
jgi:ribosomal protein S18 acetylase RimI-like enzyme